MGRAFLQALTTAKAQKLFNRTENRRRRFLPRVTSGVSAPVLDEPFRFGEQMDMAQLLDNALSSY